MSLTSDTIVGLSVAGVLAGGFFWYRSSLIEDGREEQRAEQAYADNSTLRERQLEIARLVGVTRNLQEVYDEQNASIDALERRLADRASLLQQRTAERRSAVQTAPLDTPLRDYARTAGDVYEACRGEYRALGLRIERCSATAYSLKGFVDQVTPKPTPVQRLGNLFSNPTSPEK